MRLNTYEWGDESASLVVCLHGVTGHGLRFRKLAEERLANRFHVVAADLRGHGHSTWDEPWDIATHVADLLDTFDEPANWIGHIARSAFTSRSETPFTVTNRSAVRTL